MAPIFNHRVGVFLKQNPINIYEITIIYVVSVYFIFRNVIPKFVFFGGARRHFNDVTKTTSVDEVEEKSLRKFMTKNYARLFLHILSGATQFLSSGLYLMMPTFVNSIIPFRFIKLWFLIWDTLHQATIWLMTRNHDGIFAIRVYNLAFGIVKLFFCGEMMKQTSPGPEFQALVSGLYIFTSGFAWVRLTCTVIAIAQVIFYDVDLKVLRENWYSLGVWLGQVFIALRCDALAELNMVFLLCVLYFPIELWIKKGAEYRWRTLQISIFLSAFYFVERFRLAIQIGILLFYYVYTTWFCGIYWKREPVPGVDFDEVGLSRRDSDSLSSRRSQSYRDLFPEMLADVISTEAAVKVEKVAQRAKRYASRHGGFLHRKSAARFVPGIKPSDKEPANTTGWLPGIKPADRDTADTLELYHPMKSWGNSDFGSNSTWGSNSTINSATTPNLTVTPAYANMEDLLTSAKTPRFVRNYTRINNISPSASPERVNTERNPIAMAHITDIIRKKRKLSPQALAKNIYDVLEAQNLFHRDIERPSNCALDLASDILDVLRKRKLYSEDLQLHAENTNSLATAQSDSEEKRVSDIEETPASIAI